MELQPGAYDALVTRSVADALAGSELVASVGAVDSGEAAEEYARLVVDVVRRAIASLPAAGRVDGGASLVNEVLARVQDCLLYTSPSPRDKRQSRMPSSA